MEMEPQCKKIREDKIKKLMQKIQQYKRKRIENMKEVNKQEKGE